MIFVQLLLPLGYELWTALGGAALTCTVASQVTSSVISASLGSGQITKLMTTRSILSRMVAAAFSPTEWRSEGDWGSDFSAEWASETEQSKQGGLISNFYRDQRLLDKDAFYVKADMKA